MHPKGRKKIKVDKTLLSLFLFLSRVRYKKLKQILVVVKKDEIQFYKSKLLKKSCMCCFGNIIVRTVYVYIREKICKRMLILILDE